MTENENPATGDLLIIGEALIDVVHRLDGSIEEVPGGSPANVAITLGRLGRPSELLTWIGQDDAGLRVKEWLATSDVSLISGSDGADRTTTATAILSEDGSAQYVFDISWEVEENLKFEDAGHVHLGSIGAVLDSASETVVDLVARLREHATVSYDPNARPQIMGDPAATLTKMEALIALSDVVKVSDEDIEWLVPDTDIEEVARGWAKLGPALVIVTRGGDGAVAFHGENRIEISGVSVKVVDTVGAGDTFMGALIDGLLSAGALGTDRRDGLHTLDQDALIHVLNRCARAAAVTVSRPGADPPTAVELDGPAN